MFVALTLNVYGVPVVKPDTVIGEAAAVPVKHPGVDVAVYVTPPTKHLAVDGVNGTVAVVDVGELAVPIVGVPGRLGQMLCPRA